MNHQLNLAEIKKQQGAIYFALENNQLCPFCGSYFSLVGANEDGEIYAYDCDCLMELDLAEIRLTYNNDYILDTLYPVDGNISQNSYQAPIIQNNYQVTINLNSYQVPKANKLYQTFCHHCKKFGVDSNNPNCIEDPPYKYRCMFCNHSLRSHPIHGQGQQFDIAQQNRTWAYISGRKVLLNR